jgi:hypothetical protein
MIDLNDFDFTTKEGKFLWAALIEMTAGFYSDHTPYEVLSILDGIIKDNEDAGENNTNKQDSSKESL